MSKVTNPSILSDFVTPELCKQLTEAGIKPELPFWWIEQGMFQLIATYHFDPDKYYSNPDKFMEETKLLTKYAAFRICDLDSLLPNYFLSKCDGVYSMSMESIYVQGSLTSQNLPDLFAKMTLHLLKERVLKADIIMSTFYKVK